MSGALFMKQLEQILETVKTSKYKTIDIYAVGTLAIYSSPMMNFNFPLAYNDSASSPYERQTNLSEYGMPKLPEFKLPEIQPIEIVPFKNGMELDGGFNLYGHKNTAIIHDNFTGLDYHHHNLGGGTLNLKDDRLIDLSFKPIQTKLYDY